MLGFYLYLRDHVLHSQETFLFLFHLSLGMLDGYSSRRAPATPRNKTDAAGAIPRGLGILPGSKEDCYRPGQETSLNRGKVSYSQEPSSSARGKHPISCLAVRAGGSMAQECWYVIDSGAPEKSSGAGNNRTVTHQQTRQEKTSNC